jgi:hypothetical protein
MGLWLRGQQCPPPLHPPPEKRDNWVSREGGLYTVAKKKSFVQGHSKTCCKRSYCKKVNGLLRKKIGDNEPSNR